MADDGKKISTGTIIIIGIIAIVVIGGAITLYLINSNKDKKDTTDTDTTTSTHTKTGLAAVGLDWLPGLF